MTSHIRIDKDLEEDPRVWRLGTQLFDLLRPGFVDPLQVEMSNALRGVTRNAVLGGLVMLWRYADTHITSTNALPASLQELAEVTRLPIELLRKFPDVWLIEREDGTVLLPEYTDKNALNAKEKRRAQNRARVQRWRQKRGIGGNAKSNALPVTQSNAGNASSRARAHTRVPESESETVPIPETNGREERAPGASEVPRGTEGNHTGVIDCGTALTRSAADLQAEADSRWREESGLNRDAMQAWIDHCAQLEPPKTLPAHVRLTLAKTLAGYGDADVQRRAVQRCIQGGWRNLRPLDADELASNGKSGGRPLTTAQLEDREVRRLAAAGRTAEQIAAEVEIPLDRVRALIEEGNPDAVH